MMELQPIRYAASDGVSLTGYLADGSGGRLAPGLLVAHEGGGLGRHTKQRALRLAELGYVAFALDDYGDGRPLPDDQVFSATPSWPVIRS